MTIDIELLRDMTRHYGAVEIHMNAGEMEAFLDAADQHDPDLRWSGYVRVKDFTPVSPFTREAEFALRINRQSYGRGRSYFRMTYAPEPPEPQHWSRQYKRLDFYDVVVPDCRLEIDEGNFLRIADFL